MNIETTANMHINILRKIERASVTLNKSQMYIVRLLLGVLLEDEEKHTRSWSRIRYQKRDVPENWTTFHLTLRQDEYDFTQDLRKVYRMSLSYVIAYAVDKFLDIIISKLTSIKFNNKIDCFLYSNYIVSYKKIEGVHCWQYCWGYTPLAFVRRE